MLGFGGEERRTNPRWRLREEGEGVGEQLRLCGSSSPQPCFFYPRLILGPSLWVTSPPGATSWLLPPQAALVHRDGWEAASRPRLGHGLRLAASGGRYSVPLTVTSGWWCPSLERDSAPPPREWTIFGSRARSRPRTANPPVLACH